MRSTSCASVSGTRSRARSSRSPIPGHPIQPRSHRTPTSGPTSRATACFENGELVDEPTDVTRYWRDDLVSFLLGCSFTFEWALAAAGLPLAHQRQGVNVPMYVTDRRCVRAGPFDGPLVVSMRPFAPDDVARAAEVSARFPLMHGGPVHIGDPGGAGHRRSERTGLRRSCSHRGRRGARVLGMRGDAPGGRRRGQAVAGDLPRARPHVHHRSTARRIRLRGVVP